MTHNFKNLKEADPPVSSTPYEYRFDPEEIKALANIPRGPIGLADLPLEFVEWVKENLTKEAGSTYLGLGRGFEEWIMWQVPGTSWGDYGGSTVDRANMLAIKKMFPEFITIRHGSYHSEWAVIEEENLWLMHQKFDEFKDVIEGLENYPLIDEDTHSDLEMELQNESWSDYYRKEFKEALLKSYTNHLDQMGEEEIDLISDKLDGMETAEGDPLYTIFREWQELANEYWVCEDAVSAYISIENIVKDVENDEDLWNRTLDKIYDDDSSVQQTAESLVNSLLAVELKCGQDDPWVTALVKQLLL